MMNKLNVSSSIPFTILEFDQKVSLIAGLGGKVELIEKIKQSEKNEIIPDDSALKKLE